MGLFTTWVESLYEPNKVTDKCVNHISPKSSCTICIDICPQQAIFQSGRLKKPEINLDACDECQLCVTSCPTLAIEGNLPKREYLEDTLIINKSELIFNERELLFLYKKGIRNIFYKQEGQDEFPAKIAENITHVNQILRELGHAELQYTSKLPEIKKEDVAVSRRDLFGLFREKSQQTIMTNYTPASWRNNHHLLDTNKLYPNTAFYQVDIDKETCHLCNICEALCPEDCFEKTSAESEATFIISQDKCIGCKLCIAVCPENSITIEAKVSTEDNIKTERVFARKCQTCGDPFYLWNDEAQEECNICVQPKFTF